jgi:hypothetical protein
MTTPSITNPNPSKKLVQEDFSSKGKEPGIETDCSPPPNAEPEAYCHSLQYVRAALFLMKYRENITLWSRINPMLNSKLSASPFMAFQDFLENVFLVILLDMRSEAAPYL